MRIGIIQRDDTRSVLTSSGTLYFMTLALEKHVGPVVQLGPDRSLVTRILTFVAKATNKVSSKVLHRRISPIHQKLLSLHAGRLFGSRIRQSGCDVLYAPFASVEIAHLETEIPIIYHTDMTWADAVNYYPIYSSLFEFAKKSGEQIQKEALRRSAAVILPTDWAAQSVRQDYGVSDDAVSTISYGANFHPGDLPTAAETTDSHQTSPVSLLWIGVDWVRKGGPTAFDCLQSLLAKGVDASLTVCGCVPPEKFQHPKLFVIPFLSKNDLTQRMRLSQLFLAATFFIFPSQGEAAAIVLCEASAHGLPSLVPDTGGLSSVVKNGVNGYILPVDASGEQYAEKIVKVLGDQTLYRRISETSRQEYEKRLNWDVWGMAVHSVFEEVIQRRAVQAR